jgi:hypothetical protein
MSGVFTNEVPFRTCIHGTFAADVGCAACDRIQARIRLDAWSADRRRRRLRRLVDLAGYAVLWFATSYFFAHLLVAAGVGRP